MLKKLLGETGIARKDFLTVFILLANAFAWHYMTLITINSILGIMSVTYIDNLAVWSAYYLMIIGSSIVGSILSNKIDRINFLYFWMILGAITSSSIALLNNPAVIHVLIISILLGASFGLGMPSCLAYFADHTLIENRGRISGITLLATNLSAPFFAIALTRSNLMISSIILVAWRASGLIIFFLKTEEKIASKTRSISFLQIFHDKSFVFYFTAWLMFCLVDRFEGPIMSKFLGNFFHFARIMGPLIGSLFAFIAGLLSDWVGRKRMVLYGFATLGIAYAIIGIVPAARISWYLLFIINSITTGILWVTFILILWGDLSQLGTREKYYVIGETPFFLTSIIEVLSTPYVMTIPETSAFSVAAFFLFLAVLPLLYAPETLPKRKIELRRLRKYVEAARKVKEKYEGKV
ncbi:MAG: MFS transporter [Candidatus Hydrothermarchaeota archaeon]